MATSNTRGLVVVTGGSGYIASFCIAELLGDRWRVRATLRNLARADEVRSSIGKISSNAETIEFASADLNSDAGWAEALAGADYVLHIASPVVSLNPKSDEDIIRPARDGAVRVLKAARGAGVKRVVMTSSIAAIAYGRTMRAEPFTERHWTDATNPKDTTAYERSKTIAERAAWTFQKTDGGALELVTVNPALVLGPVLGADFSPSLEAIRKLLDRSVPALPNMGFSIVDVRDVARLHVLAMTAPGVNGERFIASAGFYWIKDIARMLKREMGEEARDVPSISIPDFVVRLFAIFDPTLRGRLFELGKQRLVSSDKARQMLGWSTRPVRDTIVDAARSLKSQGLV
jgi:dihydroflavonol-4-reductase